MPQLSIIIVSYNTKNLLDRCLTSLIENIGLSDYEIIIVDNNSQDNSATLITEKYPDVKLTKNTENIGFAAAVNQGLKKATGKQLLLLNPDTVIPKTTILTMHRYLDQHPNIGVLGCQLKNMDGSPQNTFGRFPGLFSELLLATGFYKFLPWGRIRVNSSSIKQAMPVDWIGGACQMFQRELLEKIGLLDEDYCLYLEDIDFCYRANQNGYKNIYLPNVFIWHHLSASSGGSRKILPIWFNSRNSIMFQYKHHGRLNAQLVRYIVLLQLKIQEQRWKTRHESEITNNYHRVFQTIRRWPLVKFSQPASLTELKNL